MAQERLSMRCKCRHHRRKVLEVLRLKWECGLSNRAISRSCGIAASTVIDYVQRAAAAGLTWPVSGELDEDQVFRLLFPSPARATGRAIPVPDWVQLHTELRRKGVTLRLLWLEYREAHPDGYGYSQDSPRKFRIGRYNGGLTASTGRTKRMLFHELAKPCRD